MTKAEFERVALLDDLRDERPVARTTSTGERLCLVLVGGTVYAVTDRCPHADFPMSDGDMVEDHVIECALHGAQFDVRSGRTLNDVADEDLPVLEVEVRGGEVWVRPPEPREA